MLAIIIAAIALVVAGYALYCVRELKAILQGLAESLEVDEDDEPETTELWVSEGDMHAPDVAAIYEATGAIALCMSDGVPCAVVKGQGVVSLHKLLSESAKPRAVK